MARSFQSLLEPPFEIEDQELYVTASIGIGLYPHDGTDAQSLLKNSGAALYRAKQQGGNNYQFYTPDMNERALKRLALENQLRWAIERKEFKVYYQPQVNISTGQVVGMEALVRWQHPELGLVSPAEFIPLAEDTGLISPIGEWVLRTACAQTKSWQDSGFSFLHVSVNLSPRQFQQPDLLLMIERQLKESGLEPASLELEVTESSVMKNAESSISTLRELKAMGIKISIDDFGSGYSSLSYLKHLPIDVLKIDQSFVRDMTEDPKDAAIVMAIIQLAHSLQLKVNAEGVETEEQLRFLRLLRCDEMQGYLFCRPLPVEAFEQLLIEGRSLGTLKAESLSLS
jgi:EAL domain-containing protein (putative c-di-GMP-specific phosphodiesterase class I)